MVFERRDNEIVTRFMEGEPLRQISPDYGMSYESARRIIIDATPSSYWEDPLSVKEWRRVKKYYGAVSSLRDIGKETYLSYKYVSRLFSVQEVKLKTLKGIASRHRIVIALLNAIDKAEIRIDRLKKILAGYEVPEHLGHLRIKRRIKN